jgi:hypothetical protein
MHVSRVGAIRAALQQRDLVGFRNRSKLIDSGTSTDGTAATSTRRAETLCRNPLVPKHSIDRFRENR